MIDGAKNEWNLQYIHAHNPSYDKANPWKTAKALKT